METMNTVAFILTLQWVAGWTVAAWRAGRTITVPLCPVRYKETATEEYLGT